MTSAAVDWGEQLGPRRPVILGFEADPDGEDLKLRLHAFFSVGRVTHTVTDRRGSSDTYEIEYGLSGGELHLLLANADAPLAGLYSERMPDSYSDSLTTSVEQTSSDKLKGSFGVSFSGIKALISGEKSEQRQQGREHAVEHTTLSITAISYGDHPAWRFAAGPGRVIEGRAKGDEPPLARLQVAADPVHVRAAFLINDSHLECVRPRLVSGAVDKVKLAVASKALPSLVRKQAALTPRGWIVLEEFDKEFPAGQQVSPLVIPTMPDGV